MGNTHLDSKNGVTKKNKILIFADGTAYIKQYATVRYH